MSWTLVGIEAEVDYRQEQARNAWKASRPRRASAATGNSRRDRRHRSRRARLARHVRTWLWSLTEPPRPV